MDVYNFLYLFFGLFGFLALLIFFGSLLNLSKIYFLLWISAHLMIFNLFLVHLQDLATIFFFGQNIQKLSRFTEKFNNFFLICCISIEKFRLLSNFIKNRFYAFSQ